MISIDTIHSQSSWRTIPLIANGQVDPAWSHVGFGGFTVEDGALRTDCSEQGLGLLVYTKEKLGNCRIRVVYKSKAPKSNSGIYVRIDDGIIPRLDENHAPGERGPDGRLTKESLQRFMTASEKSVGPWYAVHHGYEVQICDTDGPFNRTGAVYSLSKAAAPPDKPSMEWKTMIITLQGKKVLVDIDGRHIGIFDPDGKDLPADGQWYEPKREPVRPVYGYIGLQNHDPGDVVYFKEVSVQPLDNGKDKD